MATIGFVGLGNMGGPMAANLVKADHTVLGFDLVPAARDAAKAAGVTIAETAEDAVKGADIVVTMLPNGKLVTQLYAQLLPVAKQGTLFIDSSTIDVDSAHAAHQAAATAGMRSVDAPVSGGVGGATAGTLTFMVGGAPASVEAAQPILERMGKNIVPCGEAGAGQAAKICNNMILGISMIAVSEAFVLGEKLGLSHDALFRVASTSSGQCWSINTYCPVPGPVPTSPANRDYQPGFAAALMLKDLKLSQEAATSAGADTELGRAANAIYERFVTAGGGGTDFSGIVNAIREQSK
ncbi:MAG: 3-hydroxyisobutyrate dehydrogenase [Janthinobacterium lividum]